MRKMFFKFLKISILWPFTFYLDPALAYCEGMITKDFQNFRCFLDFEKIWTPYTRPIRVNDCYNRSLTTLHFILIYRRHKAHHQIFARKLKLSNSKFAGNGRVAVQKILITCMIWFSDRRSSGPTHSSMRTL